MHFSTVQSVVTVFKINGAECILKTSNGCELEVCAAVLFHALLLAYTQCTLIPRFWIGMCCEGSRTLTLFKD